AFGFVRILIVGLGVRRRVICKHVHLISADATLLGLFFLLRLSLIDFGLFSFLLLRLAILFIFLGFLRLLGLLFLLLLFFVDFWNPARSGCKRKTDFDTELFLFFHIRVFPIFLIFRLPA